MTRFDGNSCWTCGGLREDYETSGSQITLTLYGQIKERLIKYMREQSSDPEARDSVSVSSRSE